MATMIYTQQPSVRSESMVFNALKNNDHTRDWIVFIHYMCLSLAGNRVK